MIVSDWAGPRPVDDRWREDFTLLDRRTERAAIDRVLDAVRSGFSGTLVLRGPSEEPAIEQFCRLLIDGGEIDPAEAADLSLETVIGHGTTRGSVTLADAARLLDQPGGALIIYPPSSDR